MSDSSPNISRRTLAKGAAWTVPAVAIAAAAPAHAASRPCIAPPPEITGCKYPGNSTPWTKTYRGPIAFTNNCGGGSAQTLHIKITDLAWAGSNAADNYFAVVVGTGTSAPTDEAIGFEFDVAAGGSTNFYLFWRSDNSAQADLTFTYEVTDTLNNKTTYTATTSVHWGPDCDCTHPVPPYKTDKAGCDLEKGACYYTAGCLFG